MYTYWENLEVNGRDSAGGAIVIFFFAEELRKITNSQDTYFVSMSRIDPVTQNIRLSVCRRVAPLAECIGNHEPEENVQVFVEHAHAKQCATDPECRYLR